MDPKNYRLDPRGFREADRRDDERPLTPALDRIFSAVKDDPNRKIVYGDTDSIMLQMMSSALAKPGDDQQVFTHFYNKWVPELFSSKPMTAETISKIGHDIIKDYPIEIGGSKIDQNADDWMEIWRELTDPPKKANPKLRIQKLDPLISHYEFMSYELSTGGDERRVRVRNPDRPSRRSRRKPIEKRNRRSTQPRYERRQSLRNRVAVLR